MRFAGHNYYFDLRLRLTFHSRSRVDSLKMSHFLFTLRKSRNVLSVVDGSLGSVESSVAVRECLLSVNQFEFFTVATYLNGWGWNVGNG